MVRHERQERNHQARCRLGRRDRPAWLLAAPTVPCPRLPRFALAVLHFGCGLVHPCSGDGGGGEHRQCLQPTVVRRMHLPRSTPGEVPVWVAPAVLRQTPRPEGAKERHRRTLVEAGREQPRRGWFHLFSCDPSGGRASICACLACNIFGRLGAMSERVPGRSLSPGRSSLARVFMAIPPEIQGQKYICVTTFPKSGVPVRTPVWFGEADGKLYVMTRRDSGKYKRLRNNPQVRIAPCTMRGRITGPEYPATARILPAADWPRSQAAIRRKYWLARLPIWSRQNVYLEMDASST